MTPFIKENSDVILFCVVMALVAATCTMGCQTTATSPDGTIVVTTVDWSAVFQSVAEVEAMYERIHERRDAAAAANNQIREERFNQILEALSRAIQEGK